MNLVTSIPIRLSPDRSVFCDDSAANLYCGRTNYHKPICFPEKDIGLERVSAFLYKRHEPVNRHLIDEMLKAEWIYLRNLLLELPIDHYKMLLRRTGIYGFNVTKYHPDLYHQAIVNMYEGKFQADRVKLSWDESSITNAYINQKAQRDSISLRFIPGPI